MKTLISYLRQVAALTSLLAVSGLALGADASTPIYQIGGTQGTFIQVSLNKDMYRHNLLAPDLQNLLVLDAEQNPLPYGLVNLVPASPPAERPIISDELLFFPIAVDASPDTLRRLHSEKVQLEAGTVQLTSSDKILNNQTPEFYLLDISALDSAISGLTIDWDAQEGSQYLELELEGTRNLQNWVALGRSTLVQIIQPQQSLKKNKIDIAIAKNEYEFLRLRIIRGADSLRLSKVTAEQKSAQVPVTPLAKERWSLKGELAKEQIEVGRHQSNSNPLAVAAWEFARSEATPIDTVTIDFAQATYGSSGKILSRSAENKDWELQYQGIFFNAQIGSQWQRSDPVKVYSKSAKYWRIELNDSARDKVQPRLVFAWQPMALQIIVNDKPPFFIAVDPSNNSNHSRQVFGQLAALSSAVWQPATLIPLDINPQAMVPEQSRVNWNQYLFWAALIVAVLVLMFFSWKLFKQINLGSEKT